jgi:hypothetical protein
LEHLRVEISEGARDRGIVSTIFRTPSKRKCIKGSTAMIAKEPNQYQRKKQAVLASVVSVAMIILLAAALIWILNIVDLLHGPWAALFNVAFIVLSKC